MEHPTICSLHATSGLPVHFAPSPVWACTWIVSSVSTNSRTEQIILWDVISEPFLFIDWCPIVSRNDHRIEGVRQARCRPSLSLSWTSSFKATGSWTLHRVAGRRLLRPQPEVFEIRGDFQS